MIMHRSHTAFNVGLIPTPTTRMLCRDYIYIHNNMNKTQLKNLIAECINEIAVNADYMRPNLESQIAKGLRLKMKAPSPYTGDRNDKKAFMQYLESIQDWVNENLEWFKNGIIIDMKKLKVKTNIQQEPDPSEALYYDDSYKTFEDMIEDNSDSPDLIYKGIIWISPAHVAGWLFGEDIADRIAVPR